ncbi:cytochrome P450 [Nocardioides eburneiflavus]|uniref:Cytochrome P450 n=1 Tax=Nocardioides eburneiflavus TaxID=2518372 RepID=A0A4Z1CED4_9ACTN|nr:cytochrome P450 [Nocardioides eburneiflavus]TGN63668.1 cytochrome P450 [Nocardioides eburneiflavus]
MDSVESAGGQLGAVLSAPRDGAAALGPGGPWLATSLEQARQVLTDPEAFDFPGNVNRTGDLSGSRGETRSGHTVFAPVSPDEVARGVAVFDAEWAAALGDHARDSLGEPYDAMVLLRRPVARSTTAAVLPGLDDARRDAVADHVLAWIDALGPVIAAHRRPRRWSRIRRTEHATRIALEDLLDAALSRLPGEDRTAQQLATMLAAGIQVPIAAGSFLLAWLAQHPRSVDPVHAVWETLRLTPPTWLTARVTTREVDLGGTAVPSGRVVFVSPLLLGRLDSLVPGAPDSLRDFDPGRWQDATRRPGAWLPFGAGPHACPGRTLGMAVLVRLASWGAKHEMTLSEDVRIDQSRGISPVPCRFTATARSETSP